MFHHWKKTLTFIFFHRDVKSHKLFVFTINAFQFWKALPVLTVSPTRLLSSITSWYSNFHFSSFWHKCFELAILPHSLWHHFKWTPSMPISVGWLIKPIKGLVQVVHPPQVSSSLGVCARKLSSVSSILHWFCPAADGPPSFSCRNYFLVSFSIAAFSA